MVTVKESIEHGHQHIGELEETALALLDEIEIEVDEVRKKDEISAKRIAQFESSLANAKQEIEAQQQAIAKIKEARLALWEALPDHLKSVYERLKSSVDDPIVPVGGQNCGGSRILKRLGLNRLSALEPAEPVRRYEREHPGDLIHIDIKKLGKIDGIGHRITGDRTGQSNRRSRGEGLGWEFVHVCIDDNSRIAFSKVMPDEKKKSAIAFLKAALAYYASLGVKVQRVMTDNGSCYKSFAFARACKRRGLKHIRTKPYTPKTNGKAERFIQTSLREWAYARAYHHSNQRTAELSQWLHHYNWHRPHGGIGDKTPISRLGLTRNNLLRLHT